MVRPVDYENRRKAVLGATINRYIREAEPVASEDIARDFELSSATIRNIFAELEDAGYITHPYTSGGRMPTHKGYRFYVDYLLAEMKLVEAEKENIAREYRLRMRQLEETLERTSELISAITHSAGIVSFLEWQDRFFYKGISHILEQPEFRDLKRLRSLIKTLEEKQQLLDIINREFDEKVKVYIGTELGLEEMEGCSLVVSSYRRRNKPSGRLAVLGPMRMEYRHIIPTLEYVSAALTEALETI